MVGVPRSQGCLLCRKRRIRCDQIRPHCSQCRKYGVICPGYKRSLKFQDEGPGLERRYVILPQSPEGSDESSSVTSDSRPRTALMPRRRRPEISFDECIYPSLAYTSFFAQHPRIFRDFVCASFPTMYYHNEFRFGIGNTFPDTAMKHFGSNKRYYDAIISCLAMAYLAYLNNDPSLLIPSRQMYAEALAGVKHALMSDEATSDTLLLAIILLAFYEMNVRTTNNAWILHANAVKGLMMKRGMKAHLTGAGRVCHFAFRPFLIGAAVQTGEPCFLGEDSWQELAATLRSEDSQKQSEWAFYIEVYETIFMELVKCPGYFREAQNIGSVHSPEARSLGNRIRNTCDRLRTLSKKLRTLLSSHNLRKQGITLRFVGPEPKLFPETSPSLLLRAGVDAVRILEQILTRIPTPSEEYVWTTDDGVITPPASSPESAGSPEIPPVSIRFACELGDGPPTPTDGDNGALTWLDKVAGAMGLLGAEIIDGTKSGVHTDRAFRTVRTLTPMEDELPEPRRSSD
ncbi:hypothetical protein BBP40_008710 [Aspergillus hancockii]|nr:hypothetical protein BBP40_008710 [Aspergillus hancockii]